MCGATGQCVSRPVEGKITLEY